MHLKLAFLIAAFAFTTIGCASVTPEKNRELSNIAGPKNNTQLLEHNNSFNPTHNQTQRSLQSFDQRTRR